MITHCCKACLQFIEPCEVPCNGENDHWHDVGAAGKAAHPVKQSLRKKGGRCFLDALASLAFKLSVSQ